MKPLSFLVIASLIVVGCRSILEESDETAIWSNVESVETLFVSHQGDTREKHNRVVATAHFLPDGTFDRITQHMTYPYTDFDPSDRELWADPQGDLWLHTLDGLGLGEAEKNFCYGNDWPVAYANWVQEKGHPRYRYMNSEIKRSATSSFRYDNYLPSSIVTKEEWKWDIPKIHKGYEEHFHYDKERIVSVASGYIINEEGVRLWEKEMAEKTGRAVKNNPWRNSLRETKFEYNGDLLTSVVDGDVTHKFEYDDNGRLASSDYLLRGERMTHRIYHYDDNNLKTKTEIFNRYNKKEYTILYNYKFYSGT